MLSQKMTFMYMTCWKHALIDSYGHAIVGMMRETKSLRPFLQEAGSLLCWWTQWR
jgi:hypothetical protein